MNQALFEQITVTHTEEVESTLTGGFELLLPPDVQAATNLNLRPLLIREVLQPAELGYAPGALETTGSPSGDYE